MATYSSRRWFLERQREAVAALPLMLSGQLRHLLQDWLKEWDPRLAQQLECVDDRTYLQRVMNLVPSMDQLTQQLRMVSPDSRSVASLVAQHALHCFKPPPSPAELRSMETPVTSTARSLSAGPSGQWAATSPVSSGAESSGCSLQTSCSGPAASVSEGYQSCIEYLAKRLDKHELKEVLTKDEAMSTGEFYRLWTKENPENVIEKFFEDENVDKPCKHIIEAFRSKGWKTKFLEKKCKNLA